MLLKKLLVPIINADRESYQKTPDAIANMCVIKGMAIAMFFMFGVWMLNEFGIFIINSRIMSTTFLLIFSIYLLGIIILNFTDLTQKWTKYFIIFWVVLIVTVVCSMLTYHAVLFSMLPVIYSGLYSSKNISRYACVLSVICTAIIVFVGYYNGICDTNMVLLTSEPLDVYVGADGEFALHSINDNVFYTLTMYYVVPRCIILFLFTMVCRNISNIIVNNIFRSKELEKKAEIDEMTGVYNRNKYLEMLQSGYETEDKLAVIFWDINSLKHVNDTGGHEAGDELIVSMADTIKNLQNDYDSVYRIGGDEFIMIMRGGDERSICKKLDDWYDELAKVDKTHGLEFSASVGYAFGQGTQLQDIIHRADQMMYENKRAHYDSMV